MRTHVTSDAQTQSIPRVPATVAAVTDTRVAAPGGDADVTAPAPVAEVAATAAGTGATAPAPEAEVAVPERESEAAAASTEIACTDSVQHMYEVGLAKLEALHGRWAAATAEIREAAARHEPGAAAA